MERRSGLSVAALYGALFVLTAATAWNISRLLRAADWVDHTKNVLTEVAATLDVVTTAESRQRAYLLTGDPGYRNAGVRSELEGHFTKLLILMADNPPQRRSVEELRDASLDRLAELRSLDETRERDGLEEAAALVNPAKTEHVRQIVEQLERRERDLLVQRQAASRRVASFTIATLAAGGLLLLLLIVAFHRDLDRRDRAESALAEARQAAEEANRQKDRFLASLSHELRTPLTPIVASACMLERENLSPGMRDKVEMIRRNVELEARLIDDLLDLARVTQGKVELQTKEVDLHEVLRHAIETCRHEIDARRLDFRIDLGAGAHHVRGDPARLQQVCWNLLKNATKFTPEGGSVFVRTSNDPDRRIRLSVADTGIGISPHNLSRVFEPFEQGARAKGFGGLGLGLSIAKAIVDQHGGSITGQSEGKGKGALFEVNLPTIATPEGREEEKAGGAAPAIAGIKILVVEDHGDTAKGIEDLLCSEGHEVVVAGSLEEALAAHRARPVDLVVTDIGLPDGSGIGLLAALVSIGPIRGIVVSGYGMEADLARSRAAGFRAHLVKPVTAEKLSAAIATAMREEVGVPFR